MIKRNKITCNLSFVRTVSNMQCLLCRMYCVCCNVSMISFPCTISECRWSWYVRIIIFANGLWHVNASVAIWFSMLVVVGCSEWSDWPKSDQSQSATQMCWIVSNIALWFRSNLKLSQSQQQPCTVLCYRVTRKWKFYYMTFLFQKNWALRSLCYLCDSINVSIFK